MSDNNINSKDFMIGTLIGGLVGASLALLFAPKSGKELRNDINQGASQVIDRANEWKDTAQVKGSDLKDKAYEKGMEFKQKAIDTSAQLTRAVSDKTKDLTKTVKNKLKDQGSVEERAVKAVEEIADAIEVAADALEKK